MRVASRAGPPAEEKRSRSSSGPAKEGQERAPERPLVAGERARLNGRPEGGVAEARQSHALRAAARADARQRHRTALVEAAGERALGADRQETRAARIRAAEEHGSLRRGDGTLVGTCRRRCGEGERRDDGAAFRGVRMVPNATPRTHDGLQPDDNLREFRGKASQKKQRRKSRKLGSSPRSWAANALEPNTKSRN
jgi:hypothetical protein